MAFYEMDIHTASGLNQSEVVLRLLNRDGLVCGSKENAKGYTPMMYACSYGHDEMVKLLIDLKVPPQYQSNKFFRKTALMIAATGDNLGILNMVCKDNIINLQDANGWTALHYAVMAGQHTAVRFLISQGANVDIRTCEGMTALMMSAEDGLTVIADLLLQAGADPHMVNCNNETAYSLAFNRNHISILQLLQEDPSKDLLGLLKAIGLDKYWPIFKAHNIDLRQFVTLSEENLKDLGIGLFGPRRKMALAIIEINRNIEAMCGKLSLN